MWRIRSGRRSKKLKRTSSGGNDDRLGALPDDLLNHVLSFLPSRQAVKSSFLSRRWRHLWRSTPAVRVTGRGKDDELRLFVNGLLLRRDATPLRSLEIDGDMVIPPADPCEDAELVEDWIGEVDAHVDLWVTHALSDKCRARSLVVRLEEERAPWKPRCPLTFASPHLTRIHLDAVCLVDGQLDFSCCPALLRLALVRCLLEGGALVSPSLECLAIVDCHSEIDGDPEAPDEMLHTSLSTPRLRFLEISDNYEQKQFLEMMPWLTEDSIRQYTDFDAKFYPRQW